MRIYNIEEIKGRINLERDLPKLLESQKKAFIDFSKGRIHTPAPMQLSFPKAPGDCHIKAGFKEDDDIFIVKIASGFYKNRKQGLPPGDGAVLIFSQLTGQLQAIFCDAGFLTTLRTALTACIAAQATPWEVDNIGIIGTGQLAIQILALMPLLYPHAKFGIWGRSDENTQSIVTCYPGVTVYNSIEELMENRGLVITTTASTKPIINPKYVSGKTHIIALGADEIGKQECDSRLYQRADAIIVDSKEQAMLFGDTCQAIQHGFITPDDLEELGDIINKGIPSGSNLIITDLTGIAAQDIAMARFVVGIINCPLS